MSGRDAGTNSMLRTRRGVAAVMACARRRLLRPGRSTAGCASRSCLRGRRIRSGASSAPTLVRRIAKVHGRAHVAGSSKVTAHSTCPSSTGVKRSTSRSRSLDPRYGVRSVKFVVSITSVVPSKRPRAVAHVGAHRAGEVRPSVERDDPRLVDHLVGDGHHAGPLHDAVGVAVDGRHHRAGQAARDAAVVEAAVFPRVGLTAALARLGARGRAGPRLRRERRDAAVGRIDHEPGAAVVRLDVLEPVQRAAQLPALAVGLVARGVALVDERASSAALTSSSRLPVSASGRSIGIRLSSLLLKSPCRSGSPHGVRGGS